MKRELRDAKDALDALKSHKHSGRIIEAVYLEVTAKAETAKKAGCRVSVFGMLKYLGVSRSGYAAWKRYISSDTAKYRKMIKDKIESFIIKS